MDFSGFFGDRFTNKGSGSAADAVACAACPLTGIPVGQPACLICVNAGRRLKRRLAELGLTPGVEMMVLQNNGGPLLLSVRDSRLALGRGMAAKVEVTPLPAGSSR